LLKDPARPGWLLLELGRMDRHMPAEAAAVPVPPGETLRVLMVIARPEGLADVGYQMIARPLLQRLEAVRGQVVTPAGHRGYGRSARWGGTRIAGHWPISG
jgi:hypothetical protein